MTRRHRARNKGSQASGAPQPSNADPNNHSVATHGVAGPSPGPSHAETDAALDALTNSVSRLAMADQAPTPWIWDLPDDMLEHILLLALRSWPPPGGARTVMAVCSRFRAAALRSASSVRIARDQILPFPALLSLKRLVLGSPCTLWPWPELSADGVGVSEATAQPDDAPDRSRGAAGRRPHPLAHLRALTALDCSRCERFPAWELTRAAAVPSLRHLACTRATDGALAALAPALTALLSLDLTWAPALSDAGVPSLAAMTTLTQLRVHDPDGVTDGALHHLSALTRLEVLSLSQFSKLTGSRLAALSVLTALHTLELPSWSQLRAGSLAFLPRLPSLHTLNVERAAELLALDVSALTGLTSLNLHSCTGLYDDSFRGVAALTRLQWLDITEVELSEVGLVYLQSLRLHTLIWRCYQGDNVLASDALAGLLATLPELRALDVSGGAGLEFDGLLTLGTTRLEHLSVKWCQAPQDEALLRLRNQPNLRELALSRCDNLDDDAIRCLVSVTSLASSLQVLKLTDCDDLTNAGVTLLRTLTALTHLDISGCRNVTNHGLLPLSRLTALKRLALEEVDVSARGLWVLLRGARALTSLSIAFCDFVGAKAVKAVATLPALERLDVGDCPEMTDTAVARLHRMHTLRTLTLTNCSRVTMAAVQALQAARRARQVTHPDCPGLYIPGFNDGRGFEQESDVESDSSASLEDFMDADEGDGDGGGGGGRGYDEDDDDSDAASYETYDGGN